PPPLYHLFTPSLLPSLLASRSPIFTPLFNPVSDKRQLWRRVATRVQDAVLQQGNVERLQDPIDAAYFGDKLRRTAAEQSYFRLLLKGRVGGKEGGKNVSV
ncbi:MAG: hypothetical protein MHM6MM_008396, partial [Cercozoa sp. M6MM]